MTTQSRYLEPEFYFPIVNQDDADEWLLTLSDDDWDLIEHNYIEDPDIFDDIYPPKWDIDATFWDLMTDNDRSYYFGQYDVFLEKLQNKRDFANVLSMVSEYSERFRYYPEFTLIPTIEDASVKLHEGYDIVFFQWREYHVSISFNRDLLHSSLYAAILETGHGDYQLFDIEDDFGDTIYVVVQRLGIFGPNFECN